MLFEELGKIKRSSIMTSIVMAAVGVMMIICPPQYVNAFVSIMGYGVITFAVVKILNFLSDRKSLINYIKLTISLVILLLGVAVLVFENIVLIIGIMFGLFLVILGLMDIFNAWTYARRAQRKGWWVLILLSVLQILFGLIILINPWWDEPTKLFDVIGGVLMFSSLVSIVRLVMIWPIKIEKEG